ncbi:MAG: hypothetical protein ACRDLV_10485, partial [Solirubrobacteraceae bacterium]
MAAAAPSTTSRAYHSDPALKTRTLAQIAAHRAADEILQGTYYARCDGRLRVCAVGCVLHNPDGGHEAYETELGISAQLAHLEDGLFEAMALEAAKGWPGRFMSAIQSGADLSGVWPRFASWMMLDPQWGLVTVAELEDVKAVCRLVGEAYARLGAGESIGDDEAAAITRATRAAW